MSAHRAHGHSRSGRPGPTARPKSVAFSSLLCGGTARACSVCSHGQRVRHGDLVDGSTMAQTQNHLWGNGLEFWAITTLHWNELKTAKKGVLIGGVVGAAPHQWSRGRRMMYNRR
jgi:hypothetical protein